MKIVCPECGSQEVTFGKEFKVWRSWKQEPNQPTHYYDFEEGDSSEELEDQKIECYCEKGHKWELPADASLDDYLDDE
jgi:hypothetical protein